MTSINYDIPKLKEIVDMFSMLSKMRVVIFDRDYKVLVQSNIKDCSYCRAIHQNPSLAMECNECNESAFLKCKKKKGLITYKCHAGLIEAVIDLHVDDEIIGYVMLGQFSDKDNLSEREEELLHYLADVNISEESKRKIIDEIPYKGKLELLLASNFLVSLSSYIIEESLITKSKDNFLKQLDEIICNNITQTKISSTFIAHQLNLSRSALYNLCKKFLKTSLGDRVLYNRVKLAESYLKRTELSITEISEKCGFSDYKYFIKQFKKKNGVPPGKYRKNLS